MTASPSYFLTPQAQADEEIIDYLLTATSNYRVRGTDCRGSDELLMFGFGR